MSDRAGRGPLAIWPWRILSSVSAVTLFAMMLLVAFDVCGRYLFNAPISGSFEITEYLLALLVFAALPVVVHEDTHISVSVVENILKGRALFVQRILVLAFGALSLAVIAWRMWTGGDKLAAGRQVTGYLELPRAPIAYIAAVLAAIACAAALMLIWAHIRRAPGAEGGTDPPTNGG